MNGNQRLLRLLDVSSVKIERLIEAALSAGARGAKLSGGGRGGNVIATGSAADASSSDMARVRQSLLAAGAKRVIVTRVGKTSLEGEEEEVWI
jgi:mevalonate kinase